MDKFLRAVLVIESEMSPPRVEIGGVWVTVLSLRQSVEVENKFVRREKHVAKRTSDAFRSGAVVSGRDEAALAAPSARVLDIKGKVLREARWGVLLQERLDQSLGLPLGDHTTPSG